jgi:1-acyl-sn-glycerol-3-phosphate acyltransferase
MASHPSIEGGFKRRFERACRLFATGFLFMAFGGGALLLSAFVLPVVNLRRRDHNSVLRAQIWVRRFFSTFLFAGRIMRTITVKYEGTEQLRVGSGLVIANHPTLIDVVVLGALLPQCDCVVKGDAFGNFFLSGIVEAAGYVTNSNGPDLVRECSERLEAGRTVMMFPEGTRSPDEGLGPFGRGVSHIALRSDCRIIPATIRCEPRALKKGQPWYALPNECLRFTVVIGEAVYARDLVDSQATSAVAARQLSARLRSDFETKMGCVDA